MSAGGQGPAFTTWQVAWRLHPLYFTHILQAILTTMPFVLAVYMVRDWEAAAHGAEGVSEQAVGRATGLLAAMFCAAQLVTSYPWGHLSDRIGRKPLMVVGNLSGAATVLWFGLAGSYGQAMAARAIGGAANAIILAEKSILGEGLPDKATQAKGFGLMSLCWGVGSLAGPIIGGSLASPCAGRLLGGGPLCGEGSLLVLRPYFLPCLLAGVLSAIATVLTIVSLPETLPSRRAGGGLFGGGAGYQQVPAAEDAEAPQPPPAAADSARGGELELQPSLPRKGAYAAGLQPGYSNSGSGKVRAFRGDSARMLGDRESASLQAAARRPAPGAAEGPPQQQQQALQEQQQQALQEQQQQQQKAQRIGPQGCGSTASSNEDADFIVFGPSDLEAPEPAGPGAASGAAAAKAAAGARPAKQPWYRQRKVVLALSGYGLIAWCFNMLDEVTPLFASAAVAEGGLGFTPAALAPSLSFGGIVLCVWALRGFPWLHKRVGVVRALRLGLYQSAPAALLVPAASLFAGRMLPSQAAMFLAMAAKAVSGTNAFTGCLIIVNAAAPPDALGAVNGVGQSLASLVRALGPALGGLSWALSLQLAEQRWWPAWLPHQYLPFAAAAAMALGTDAVYRRMPEPEEGGAKR